MRIIDPGHTYGLKYLDAKDGNEAEGILTFVKRTDLGKCDGCGDNVSRKGKESKCLASKDCREKEEPKYPGNTFGHAGTTCQEVIRALIERVQYLDNQIPDWRNKRIIDHLEMSLWQFESRAAERHDRALSSLSHIGIELLPTCPKCLHIGCTGTCHV